jgi:hypothetical protein
MQTAIHKLRACGDLQGVLAGMNGWYEWLMYELFEPCNAGTLTSMLKECAAS